jgi:hypothetical protein
VAKDSSGTPPIAASGSSGPSGWPNPTRPHGIPPKGTRERTASPISHTAAAHSGHSGSRVTRAIPATAAATNSDSNTDSAIQGTSCTSAPTHTSSGSRKARENTNPSPRPARAERPRTTWPSSANAGRARYQAVLGGKLR